MESGSESEFLMLIPLLLASLMVISIYLEFLTALMMEIIRVLLKAMALPILLP